MGVSTLAKVSQTDIFKWHDFDFDIITIDPPYHQNLIGQIIDHINLYKKKFTHINSKTPP